MVGTIFGTRYAEYFSSATEDVRLLYALRLLCIPQTKLLRSIGSSPSQLTHFSNPSAFAAICTWVRNRQEASADGRKEVAAMGVGDPGRKFCVGVDMADACVKRISSAGAEFNKFNTDYPPLINVRRGCLAGDQCNI